MTLPDFAAVPLRPFPALSWWQGRTGPQLFVSGNDWYNKRQHPNRYDIGTAGGRLSLSVPLAKGRDQQGIQLSMLAISYATNWRRQHWRTIQSAYGRAAFWDHYRYSLEDLFNGEWPLFSGFCLSTIRWAAEALSLSVVLCADAATGMPALLPAPIPYYQVFQERNGFLENLSILDLLLNEGPHEALNLLQPVQ